MQKLYSANDRVLMYLLKAKLIDHGIHCIIKNDEPIINQAIGKIALVPDQLVLDMGRG